MSFAIGFLLGFVVGGILVFWWEYHSFMQDQLRFGRQGKYTELRRDDKR